MRRGVSLIALSLSIAAAVALSSPTSSQAARVVVLSRDGRTVVRNDPYLSSDATPRPAAISAARASRARPRRPPDRNVRTELARLWRTGAIPTSAYRSYLNSFNAALSTVKRLKGTRATELEAVVENLHGIAARGQLTPSRLPVLFLTLDRNRQWWTTGPLLSTYQRVQFTGSQLVWEYYPGQGIELQELGSFSTADALCKAGPSQHAACAQLLAELIPLAARRDGRIAWEYYFSFDGGLPPWTSAMSQGTALAALADAYTALGDPSYLAVGERALSLFTAAPPAGVAVPTSLGARYVQYTFDSARGDEIINAFLQSLIGLDDFAQTSGSSQAAQLFAAGNAEAMAELPQFDTGAWSLYQPGLEDDLSYHELVTGFLQRLCTLAGASVYCTTASHFEQYLKQPPALQLLTAHLAAHRPASVAFRLSKVSRVGIVVRRGARTVFLTSAPFSYGRHTFAIPTLPAAGTYTVHLTATDLADNYSQIDGAVHVSRPPRRPVRAPTRSTRRG